MPTHAVPIDVPIGDNLRATNAWFPGGPIVLVHIVDALGGEFNSRLDVQKAAFLDPLPSLSQERLVDGAAQTLVASLPLARLSW